MKVRVVKEPRGRRTEGLCNCPWSLMAQRVGQPSMQGSQLQEVGMVPVEREWYKCLHVRKDPCLVSSTKRLTWSG